MKICVALAAGLSMLLIGCAKESLAPVLATSSSAISKPFKEYLIAKGGHYANDNILKAVETDSVGFTVKFDSSAIYQTADPANQDDINKLYGFSDNGQEHHQFSARFGWRWSSGALRLFAYTYNNGIRDSKELGIVPIGKEIHCAIKVAGEAYTFLADGKRETMNRLSITQKAKGYQLYPYFGGDEAAPHDVRIWIREE